MKITIADDETVLGVKVARSITVDAYCTWSTLVDAVLPELLADYVLSQDDLAKHIGDSESLYIRLNKGD